MTSNVRYPEHLVFGLDIGTRSIVGTVGYKENEKNFKVIAQVVKMHETRAMLDGQIHDIHQVSQTIGLVKQELEGIVGRKLTDVCIAAAGRVLKTVTVKAEYELPSETIIQTEHIHSLELLGVEKAYEALKEEVEGEDLKFYCVGYTVIRYFLNDYMMTNLEGHKGHKISAEVLATFLPDEVIDGLYIAVERAGLKVANLTLEPIAAIEVAIPVQYRLLNIALVDVGAGTSDISITKDGSIIGYGMIPSAGDVFTEEIAKKYLVEFKVAETIKMACISKKQITYKDILGITHKITAEEVLEALSSTLQRMTHSIAEKIRELNGNKSVSAVFVVGGGGKLPGFTNYLAQYLELAEERVALRGEEVLEDVEFLQEDIKKDSLLVTPIGICLNFYEKNNNFIYVVVNGERIKLYDNNKLTIMDAAIQIGFPNTQLFPRRGKEINFMVNAEKRLIRGEAGEGAIVRLNGKTVGISNAIVQNDVIEITPSTIGAAACYEINQMPEYKGKGSLDFVFNGQKITCPKLVVANGQLVSAYYSIQEGDLIEVLNYYTLEQILAFMDVAFTGEIFVNHDKASLQDKIYENFSITCDLQVGVEAAFSENGKEKAEEALLPLQATDKQQKIEDSKEIQSNQPVAHTARDITVTVNGADVVLSNKAQYILVDVLDFYPFDLSVAKGKSFVTKINDRVAQFTDGIQENDRIELYWEN